MSFPSTRVDHPAHILQQDLERYLVQRDDDTQCFIPFSCIEKCWPDNIGDLKHKLGLHSWRSADAESLLPALSQHCRLVVCILAWIRYDQFEDKLKDLCSSILKKENGGDRFILQDSCLILDENTCIETLGFQSGKLFYRDQFVFCPIVISSTGKGIQEIHTGKRWPYTAPPTGIGFGAFGYVSRVRIARGQLEGTKGYSNINDEDIAFKKVNRPDDWRREVKILDFLKESLSDHKRLTLHIAAFIQGQKFYIFMPYTPLGDLEIFFSEGLRRDENSQEKDLYDFAQTFKSVDLVHLANEFASIIDATAWLHNKVSSTKGIPVYCVHADLRPKNILIFPVDDGSPAGVWRISDFGISSIKLENDENVPEPRRHKDHPSIGDILFERWSPSGTQSKPRKLEGTYVAPERSMMGVSMPKQSDVWSLGCIFAEVVVFGLGTSQKGSRKRRLGHFRQERHSFHKSDRDDYFFDRDDDPASPIDHSQRITIRRRDKVGEWLQNIHDEHGAFCRDLAKIIDQMLQPDPDNRCTAQDACKSTLKACSSHADDMRTSPVEQPGEASASNGNLSTAPPWIIWAEQSMGSDICFEVLTKQPQESPRSPEILDVTAFDTQSANFSDGYPQKLRTIARARNKIWDKNGDGLSKPAIDVKTSNSEGITVYLCEKTQGRSTRGFLGRGPAKRVYELRFRNFEQHDTDFRAAPPYKLPTTTDWRDLHVSGKHVVVTDRNFGTHIRQIHIYNFVDHSMVGLPQSDNLQRMHTVLSSCQGVFAAYDQKEFLLWQPGQEIVLCKVSPPLSPHGQLIFSVDGQLCFTWSCRNQKDFIQVWTLKSPTHIRAYASCVILRARRRAPLDMLLVPCGSLPACVVRNGQGNWFTASARPHSQSQMPMLVTAQKQLDSVAHQKHVLCVASEHHFFYLDSHQEIWAYGFVWTSEFALQLQNPPTSLGTITLRHVKSMTVHMKDRGAIELKFCNLTGAVEHVSIEH